VNLALLNTAPEEVPWVMTFAAEMDNAVVSRPGQVETADGCRRRIGHVGQLDVGRHNHAARVASGRKEFGWNSVGLPMVIRAVLLAIIARGAARAGR